MSQENTALTIDEEKAETAGTSRRERLGDACIKGAHVLAAGMAMTPGIALAESPSEMLPKVLQMLSGGVMFLGGVLVVMGMVNLGMSLKDGAQGGGGQLAGAIAMIVGGGVIVGAGAFFNTLDTSWAK